MRRIGSDITYLKLLYELEKYKSLYPSVFTKKIEDDFEEFNNKLMDDTTNDHEKLLVIESMFRILVRIVPENGYIQTIVDLKRKHSNKRVPIVPIRKLMISMALDISKENEKGYHKFKYLVDRSKNYHIQTATINRSKRSVKLPVATLKNRGNTIYNYPFAESSIVVPRQTPHIHNSIQHRIAFSQVVPRTSRIIRKMNTTRKSNNKRMNSRF